jgi:hypothetical protein
MTKKLIHLSNIYFIKVVDNVIVTVRAKEDAQTSKPIKPSKLKKPKKYAYELMDDYFEDGDSDEFENL